MKRYLSHNGEFDGRPGEHVGGTPTLLEKPSLPLSKAEDSMQTSGSEKTNARQPPPVSTEPGNTGGLFIA